MKRILILLLPLALYSFMISCDTSPDFSETVVITDDPDPNDPDPNDPNDPTDPTDPDPNDPDPQTPLVYPVECDGVFAGPYPCSGYDLMGWLSTGSFIANAGNDCWGWTDPMSGTEYAIYGLDNGTAFVDITDPSAPIFTAKVYGGTGGASIWRDIKVYNNYAYIVSEAGGHGMQVFDLTRLRDVVIAPELLEADNTYLDFGNAHNIVINEETGFAYAVGTNTFGGGPHFVDLQDPANPVAAGGYAGGGYSHDAQVVIYNGPDVNHIGKEIFIGSNANTVDIVDVTDKSNPISISSISYADVSYTHQGWLTENHQYLIVGDETDELDFGFNTKTIILDLTDLSNPQHLFDYFGTNSSIDHNGYVVGSKFYLSSYSSGLRIMDISGIGSSSMAEIGHFDVHPADNNPSFNGAWSVYPYFASGNIVISDTQSGLFIVKAQ